MTDKLRAAYRDERVKRIAPAVRNWMQDKRDDRSMEEVIYAALAAAPQPATPGQRMIRAAEEAVAIARGEAEPASVYPAPQPAPRRSGGAGGGDP